MTDSVGVWYEICGAVLQQSRSIMSTLQSVFIRETCRWDWGCVKGKV